MSDSPSLTNRSRKILTIALWVAFLLSAVVTAYIAFNAGGDVATAQLEENPPQPSPTLPPTPKFEELEDDVPLHISDNRPPSKKWDGEEPIVILLIGLDTRTWLPNSGPGLTDTIILATLDPENHRAGLLSIPRDLWIGIPIEEHSPIKINQAYMIGEGTGYEGGGPGLLMDSLGRFLGTEIDYYASVDFQTFIILVDAVGGVKVDIKETLIVDPSPGVDDGMKKIETGKQVLPGGLALGYVRTRNTPDGDFGRAERQQEILIAIQKRLINFDMLPKLIKEFPILYRELSDGIKTNFTFKQLITLGWESQKIPPENIHHTVIREPMVEIGESPNGLWILIPQPAQIRAAWDNLLTTTTTTTATTDLVPQATQEAPLEELVEAEEAIVTVQNGTTQPGLAGNAADFLRKKEIYIGEVGNAEQYAEKTFIYDYSGNPYTDQYLLEIMELDDTHLYHRYDPDASHDILIILGEDWLDENPIP